MKEPRKLKLANYAIIALFILVISIGGLFIYWTLSSSEVLVLKNLPFPAQTVPATAATDGLIELKVDYCKKVNATGIVRISFVSNAREVFLPIAPDKQPAQCLNTNIPIIIPKDLPPDTYHIHFHVVYKVNPLKTTTQDFDSKSFTVK